MRPRLTAAAAGLCLAAGAAAPAGAPAADPPYAIPPGPTSAQAPPSPDYTPASPDYSPSLPLVAAVALPKGQKLGQVLRQGLRLRVYAYQPIEFSVSATLAASTARRVHLRRSTLAIPHRSFRFDKAGAYHVRVRLTHRVVTRLRHLKRATLRLRTALRAKGNETSTVSPVALAR